MLYESVVRGVFGRFTVGALMLTFPLYSPYYFQGPRYLHVRATGLNIAAAVLLTRRWRHPSGQERPTGARPEHVPKGDRRTDTPAPHRVTVGAPARPGQSAGTVRVGTSAPAARTIVGLPAR